MKKNIVIILLSIVILGLGGYLVYDKVLSSDNKEEVVEKQEEIIKKEKEAAIVSDLVNGKVIQTYVHTGEGEFQIDENEVPYVEAAIPYINLETEETKKINDEIQKEYSEVIDVVKNNVKEQKGDKGPYTKVVNYTYTVGDNILFIIIESSWGMYRAGGGSSISIYYYDIKNDKVLNTKEVLEKLEITEDTLMQRMPVIYEDRREQIKNNLEDNIAICKIGNTTFIIPKNMYTFTIFEM